MIVVTPSMQARLSVNLVGDHRKPLKAVYAKRFSGIWIIKIGGNGYSTANTGPSVLATLAETFKTCLYLTSKGIPYERYHSGGRLRHPLASHYPWCVQTAAAGLRQADDLLSAVGINAGGHSRDIDYFHAPGLAQLPELAG